MQATPPDAVRAERYELRFRALSSTAQSCSFPCDACGHVDLDALSERVRNAYYFARIVIGHELAPPQVHRVATLPAVHTMAAAAGRETRLAATR